MTSQPQPQQTEKDHPPTPPPPKKPPHLQSKQLFPIETNWPADLHHYKTKKESLEWGRNPLPTIITQQQKNKQDNIFNPITQKYHNKTVDTFIQSQERESLKHKLPIYYDKQLTNEQTYNIITLQDKLKHFESHPQYPKSIKHAQKLNKETSNVAYNIISNHSLSKHHYAAPEKRPPLMTEPPSQRIQKVNAINYKDYDIINCKYKSYDKEKKKTEIEIEQLTAAKKLFMSRDYDTIRGIYYDPDKQAQYEKQLREKNEQIRKNFKRRELYNPVNNIVYDKDKLCVKDNKECNRKLRYTLKPQLEEYYKMKSLQHEIMNDNAISNKLDYTRYKIQDKRGYDVINWKNTYNNYKNMVGCRNKTTAWDELKEKAGENETFSKKEIYTAPYDKSEIDHHKYEFNMKRDEMLKKLPKLEEEVAYQRKDYLRKNVHSVEGNRNFKNENMNLFDKDKWFKSNKSVERMEKVPYYNKPNPVKSQIFI